MRRVIVGTGAPMDMLLSDLRDPVSRDSKTGREYRMKGFDASPFEHDVDEVPGAIVAEGGAYAIVSVPDAASMRRLRRWSELYDACCWVSLDDLAFNRQL